MDILFYHAPNEQKILINGGAMHFHERKRLYSTPVQKKVFDIKADNLAPLESCG